MSAPAPTSATPKQRKSLVRRSLAAAGQTATVVALISIGGAAFLQTPWGLDIIERAANGAKAGPFGTLSLSKLSGNPLGAMRAGRLAIADAKGEWLIVNDVSVRLNAWALFGGMLDLESVQANSVSILHRPSLTPDDGQKNKQPLDFRLRNLDLPRIALAPGVAGEKAQLRLRASGESKRNHDSVLQVDLRRLDSESDALSLDWRARHDGWLRLKAEARGAPNGVFANILGAPQGASVNFTASAKGEEKSGQGHGGLMIGGEDAARANAVWANGALDLRLNGDLAAIAQTRGFAQRVGGPFAITLKMTPTNNGLQTAALEARFVNAALLAKGVIDAETSKAPQGLDVKIQARKLSALGGGFDWADGPAGLDGKLFHIGEGYGFKGQAQIQSVDSHGFGAARVSGPIELRVSDQEIHFQGVAEASGTHAAQPALGALIGPKAQLDAAGAYDRVSGEVRISKARLTGTAMKLRAEGEFAPNGPARLEGALDVTDLTVLQRDLKGRANLRFGAMRKNKDDALTIAAQGGGFGVSGASQFAKLLGSSPRLQIESSAPAKGGWRIQRASLNGENLRAGAKGAAAPNGALNVDFEAAAKGPFDIGAYQANGAIDAFGKVLGQQDNPNVSLQARIAKIDAFGVEFSKTSFKMSIPALGKKLAGSAALEAETIHGPLKADAQFAFSGGRARLSSLNAAWSGATLNGDVELGGGEPAAGLLNASGSTAFAGMNGAFSANLKLSRERGEQGVDLNLSANDLMLDRGGGAYIESLSLRAQGRDSLMAIRAAASGEASKPFDLIASGSIAMNKTERRALITLGGDYGGARIASSGPIDFRTSPNGMSLAGELRAGGGSLLVDWRRKGDMLDAKMTLADAPASLGGLISPRLRLDGVLSGDARLSGSGKKLTGAATLKALRLGPEGAAGSGVDGVMAFTLTDGRLTASLEAASPAGLAVKGHANLAAQASAQPFKIAFDPKAKAAGAVSIQGPAKDAWRIFGPTQQYLDGRVDLNASMTGTIGAPIFSGAGALTNGVFEDAATGMKLRNVAANMQFAGSKLQIVALTGRDKDGGSASASGAIDFNEKGANAKISVTMKDLRFLDRDDIRATGSGAINYTAVPGEAALISGAVKADRFDLSAPEAGPGAGAAIAVTHKNLPRQKHPAAAPRQAGKPLQIDVAIRAPARVFVRGRGLESEWSLDARLRGDLARPTLAGEAELIRGDYDLLGKRFDLQSGQIVFNGPANQAKLDIAGQRVTTDLTAIIKVAGTIAKPEITLSSQPALPNDEVLARVLFERSATQLSALEAAQLAAGVAALSGRQGFDLAGAFRSVGLDRFSFNQNNGVATVAGGKYISDNVYLEVAGGAQGDPAAQIEWEPRPNLSLVSRFAGTQDSRVSVRWKKDY